MSSEGIQFDEDSMSNASRIQMSQNSSNSGQSGMVGWLMRKGIAKTPAVAQGILLGVVIAVFVITYFILF